LIADRVAETLIYTHAAMENVLSAVQVLISVILIFLVLLHSGKDTGLSGAFGIGQTGSSFGGGSLVERNLDRWTIFFSILFVVNTLVLLKI
jgi:preprotein translocase subunit SecG